MALPTANAVEAPVVELAVVTTAGSRVWVRLRTHPSAMVGVSILALYVVATLLGPLVLRWDPIHQTLSDAFLAASSGHPLGTDDLGRDELVRLMFGARYTLSLGFAAVAIGLAIGVPVGRSRATSEAGSTSSASVSQTSSWRFPTSFSHWLWLRSSGLGSPT